MAAAAKGKNQVVLKEIMEFAEYLGMDPVEDGDLLWIGQTWKSQSPRAEGVCGEEASSSHHSFPQEGISGPASLTGGGGGGFTIWILPQ